MRIKKVPVSQINPAPYNQRKQLAPGDPDYEKLLRSIDEFGLVEPLVWNKRSGNLVGGHQRLSVLLARGEFAHSFGARHRRAHSKVRQANDSIVVGGRTA